MDSQSELEADKMSADNKDIYKEKLKDQSKLASFNTLWSENANFEKKSKYLLTFINLQMLVIIAMTIGLYLYVSSDVQSDRFFTVNGNSRPRQIAGLYRPNNSRDALAIWVSDAVVDVFTFGFNDYRDRFAVSSQHFTKDGWAAFLNAARATGFVRGIEESKQILTAAPSSYPVLLKDGYMDGSFKWVFQVNLLLTYRSGSSQSNNRKKVIVFVEKIPTSENPKGVGISSLLL